MKPVEIFEYKQSWKPGYTVRLHSDLRRNGKDYCKTQMMQQQWDITTYTNVYEDTFHFEYLQDAKMFKAQWPQFVDQ